MQNLPEEIPFTNDDAVAKNAAASPTCRATKDDECIKFAVVREEPVILDKGLYPGAYAIRMLCAPVDGNDTILNTLAVRHELVLPTPNPDSERFAEVGPDTSYSVYQYFHAMSPQTYPALPMWNKEGKFWTNTAGQTISKQEADAAKEKGFAAVTKALREAWNSLRKGESVFTNDLWYARVKASPDGKYRNLKNISGAPITGTSVVTKGFKTVSE